MKSITAQLNQAFHAAIKAAFGLEADPVIQVAQNDKFGDYQANAAMGLVKPVADKTGAKANPRSIAERIKAALDLGPMASEVTIAGPGFINVRLAPAWLAEQLRGMGSDSRLGVDPVASPANVIVDYSGPNIAKELHVGHLRSTILGDALARLIAFQGHHVIRQNHLGDWGTQFGMLIANLLDKSANSQNIRLSDLEAFYVEAKKRFDSEPDFQNRARQTVVKLQGGDQSTLAAWRTLVAKTREHYLPLYRRLGVLLTEADERGESFYNPMLAEVVSDLLAAGIAEESEGAIVVFIDGKDKVPLIIQKSGGGYLYGTTDLAAVRYRTTTLHPQRVIYLVDSRQSHHFSQVFAVAARAGWAPGVSLEHAPFGTMLGIDGRPFRSRAGGLFKLQDLLDQAQEQAMAVVTSKNPDLPEAQRYEIAASVGVGGIKYFDMSRDRASDYTFSFERMLALDGNTAPYLQYAYARTRSILREGHNRGIVYAGAAATPIRLETPHELAIAKQILRLGDIVELVARELKPHHLCTYLYDLATRLSGFYENCPVLQSDPATRSSRLALVDLTGRTLALGLDLLGIEHPEKM